MESMNYLMVRLIVVALVILSLIIAMVLGFSTEVGVPMVTTLVGVLIGAGDATVSQRRQEGTLPPP